MNTSWAIEKFWKEQRQRRKPNHPAIAEFADPKVQWILEHINYHPKMSLLDAGCGNGFFTARWRNTFHTTGIDSSETMLKQNPHQNIIQGDITQLPFEDHHFDICFCSNVLYYLDDAQKALNELSRVSSNYVIIVMPNMKSFPIWLFSLIAKVERRALNYPPKKIDQMIRIAGLKKVTETAHGLVSPTQTPVSLLPFIRKFNQFKQYGLFRIYICQRPR